MMAGIIKSMCLAAVMAMVWSVAASDIPPPTASYPFDENEESTAVTDNGTGGRNAETNVNTAGMHQVGKVGKGSFLFDGSRRVIVPDNEHWDFGTNDWTIMFWVKFDNLYDHAMFVHHYGAGERVRLV